MPKCGYEHKLLNCRHGTNPIARKGLPSLYMRKLRFSSARILEWRKAKRRRLHGEALWKRENPG